MTWMEDLLTFVMHSAGVEHSPQRRKVNFVGAQLTDDSVNEWTTIYIGNTNDWKGSVRVATLVDMAAVRTGNTLTASGNGNINTLGGIDSITDLALGELILFKDEAAQADNGIYYLTDLGSATTPWIAERATLADDSAEVTPGLSTYVEEGTINGRTTWRLKTTNVVLNTTSLEFESMVVDPCVIIDSTDSPYQVLIGQRVILVDTSIAAVTVVLPPAADWQYGEIRVKDVIGNAAVSNITIDGSGAELIDTAANYAVAAAFRGVTLYSDGTYIWVLNHGS